MIKSKSHHEIGKEKVFKRLGKSIIANKIIKAGEKILIDDLSGRIFTDQFIPVRDSYKVIGKIAKSTIKKNDIILYKNIK